MRRKEAILLDSVDLVQARNCQARLKHAFGRNRMFFQENIRASVRMKR